MLVGVVDMGSRLGREKSKVRGARVSEVLREWKMWG